ncbi:MAG: response regulator [Deltaproteobacteria bacterium]|nr:MAG: response regulator [Deltaproteobacteria bacterium]
MARYQHVRPILLVEDDPDLRDAVRLVLEDAGYDVVCAGEGREALARVRESPFSLVLLDLMMPVMDGFEFRVQQMQDPNIASIPVIVFSCGNDLEEKVAPLRVSACLRKPIDVDALIALSGDAEHDATRRAERDAGPELAVEPAPGAAEVDGSRGLLGLVHQHHARGEVAADEPVPDVAVPERRAEIHVVAGPPGVGQAVAVVAEPVAARGDEEIGGERVLGAPWYGA